MNVLKRYHHVLLMQCVKILKEASPVHVLKDTMVMVTPRLVQVSSYITNFCAFERLIILSLNLHVCRFWHTTACNFGTSYKWYIAYSPWCSCGHCHLPEMPTVQSSSTHNDLIIIKCLTVVISGIIILLYYYINLLFVNFEYS